MSNRLISSALLAILASILLLNPGCRSGKVIREDFSNLQRIEVPEAGISFLFPPDRSKIKILSEHTISAYLNPVDENPGIGQDAAFMMSLSFRKRESPMTAKMVGKGVNLIHGEGAPAAGLESAYRCPNGDLWRTEIEVRRYSIDGHEYFEEDIEIAKRILESVECLPSP